VLPPGADGSLLVASDVSAATPEELRESIATFLARLASPEVSWVDEHLLVVAGASRRNQVEP